MACESESAKVSTDARVGNYSPFTDRNSDISSQKLACAEYLQTIAFGRLFSSVLIHTNVYWALCRMHTQEGLIQLCERTHVLQIAQNTLRRPCNTSVGIGALCLVVRHMLKRQTFERRFHLASY